MTNVTFHFYYVCIIKMRFKTVLRNSMVLVLGRASSLKYNKNIPHHHGEAVHSPKRLGDGKSANSLCVTSPERVVRGRGARVLVHSMIGHRKKLFSKHFNLFYLLLIPNSIAPKRPTCAPPCAFPASCNSSRLPPLSSWHNFGWLLCDFISVVT